MRRIVVVGGSIAAVTAASSLRAEGWSGELTLLSDEHEPPYSRVPLSKGVLAGTQALQSAALPGLPADVDVRLGSVASALHPERRQVELADGTLLDYDGLVVATGARARRLAARGQEGEHVIRTLSDVRALLSSIEDAHAAVVVGASFLGMEVASTLVDHGLTVTVVDRDPPLRRLLGEWLADIVVEHATAAGMRFRQAAEGVRLMGNPVNGVELASGEVLRGDVVVSAVGDQPNVEWLASAGLPMAGGLVVDSHCRVAAGIVAAGDVTVTRTETGVSVRTPHWSNAVAQGRTAARSLMNPAAPPGRTENYFWTEQFGVDLKIAGHLPPRGGPEVVEGDPRADGAVVRWAQSDAPVTAAAWNYRIPVAKLKKLAAESSDPEATPGRLETADPTTA